MRPTGHVSGGGGAAKLLSGRTVVELGAGVGVAGLA